MGNAFIATNTKNPMAVDPMFLAIIGIAIGGILYFTFKNYLFGESHAEPTSSGDIDKVIHGQEAASANDIADVEMNEKKATALMAEEAQMLKTEENTKKVKVFYIKKNAELLQSPQGQIQEILQACDVIKRAIQVDINRAKQEAGFVQKQFQEWVTLETELKKIKQEQETIAKLAQKENKPQLQTRAMQIIERTNEAISKVEILLAVEQEQVKLIGEVQKTLKKGFFSFSRSQWSATNEEIKLLQKDPVKNRARAIDLAKYLYESEEQIGKQAVRIMQLEEQKPVLLGALTQATKEEAPLITGEVQLAA